MQQKELFALHTYGPNCVNVMEIKCYYFSLDTVISILIIFHHLNSVRSLLFSLTNSFPSLPIVLFKCPAVTLCSCQDVKIQELSTAGNGLMDTIPFENLNRFKHHFYT